MGVASVGIAYPAAPKKMIPISHRNGEVSEKAGSESRGDGFLGLGKSGWKPLAVSRRKYWGWKCSVEGQRVYTHESEGQKTNSGLHLSLGL